MNITKFTKAELHPHQLDGVKFLFANVVEGPSPNGCILAEAPGLGKTVQLLTFITATMFEPSLAENIARVLVLCPANVIDTWLDETKKWVPYKYYKEMEIVGLNGCQEKSLLHIRDDDEGVKRVIVMSYKSFEMTVKRMDELLLSANGQEKGYKLQKIFLKDTELLVCDEAHHLKNAKTSLYGAISRIEAKKRVLLSGTPLQNNLREYYHTVQIACPDFLGDRKTFEEEYVKPSIDAMAKTSEQKARAELAHKELYDALVEGGKVLYLGTEFFAKMLPVKTDVVLHVRTDRLQQRLLEHFNIITDPKNETSDLWVMRKIYTHPLLLLEADTEDDEARKESARRRRRRRVSENDDNLDDFIVPDAEVVAEHPELAQVTEELAGKAADYKSPAQKAAEQWGKFQLEEVYANSPPAATPKLRILEAITQGCHDIGDKLVVFSLSLDSIRKICAVYDSHGYRYDLISGSTPRKKRTEICNAFQQNGSEWSVLIIATGAGGEGITLTEANRLILFDTNWNPAKDNQAAARIYRIGQKKPTYIYRLVQQGCMEERIYNKQTAKLVISSEVLQGHTHERQYDHAQLTRYYHLDFINEYREGEEMQQVQDTILSSLLENNRDQLVRWFHFAQSTEQLPVLEEPVPDEEFPDLLEYSTTLYDACFEIEGMTEEFAETVCMAEHLYASLLKHLSREQWGPRQDIVEHMIPAHVQYAQEQGLRAAELASRILNTLIVLINSNDATKREGEKMTKNLRRLDDIQSKLMDDDDSDYVLDDEEVSDEEESEDDDEEESEDDDEEESEDNHEEESGDDDMEVDE